MSQARQQMTMRARIVRPLTAGTNDFGEPLPDIPDVIHDALPCNAWTPVDAREQLDAASAAFDTVRLAIPTGSDVTEGDTIESVSDRRGVVLFTGPLRITGVTRRSGHVAVMALAGKSGGI